MVYDTLRQRIASGELPPGEFVREASLAEEFGVSRTPIREAIKFLAWEGLLERSERDMRVRVLDLNQVLDIYEVRISLEAAAAHAAASRRTDVDIAHLRHAMRGMNELPDAEIDKRPGAAYDVHFAIWSATHNRTLIETLERLQLVVASAPSTTLHYPERWKAVKEQLGECVDAIAARDADHAAELARQQMTDARDARIAMYTPDSPRQPWTRSW